MVLDSHYSSRFEPPIRLAVNLCVRLSAVPAIGAFCTTVPSAWQCDLVDLKGGLLEVRVVKTGIEDVCLFLFQQVLESMRNSCRIPQTGASKGALLPTLPQAT